MTKTQLVYNSANDGSIDGDRFIDNSVSNDKLESGIDGTKLSDGSVPLSKLNESAGSISSASVTYQSQASGAVVRTVRGRLDDVVNVRDFGIGEGGDDTQAFSDLLSAYSCVFIPADTIVRISSTITIPNRTFQLISI